jgi:hypothetical protein
LTWHITGWHHPNQIGPSRIDTLKNEGDLMATLTDMPEYMTPQEVAQVVRKTVDSLAQDRYLKRGLPYIKVGTEEKARVLYARADVAAFLAANRTDPSGAGA